MARSRRSPPDAADDRWVTLLQRYQGVVYRYLLGSLRDADAADELFQEFALRCLQGPSAAPTSSAAGSATI